MAIVSSLRSRTWLALMASAAMAACAQSETKLGTDQGPISGSAGPNGSSGASSQLEKCEKPLGIIALVESQDPSSAQALSSVGLGSPLPVLRLLMQQSNCFIVADRGQAMQNILQERQLNQSGELRGGSNFGGGQLVSPDLALTPNVIFSGNTGGNNAGLSAGSFIPGIGGLVAGSVANSMKFTSAQSILTLTDTRSGLQVSAANGTATARDQNIGASLFGAGGGAFAGGNFGSYTNTPEGKVVAASLMDAFNNVVKTVRGMPPLASVAAAQGIPIGGARPSAASTGAPTRAGTSGIQAGQTYAATGNLNLREGPSGSAGIVGRATVGTLMKATGKTSNGYAEVEYGDFKGWVLSTNLKAQ